MQTTDSKPSIPFKGQYANVNGIKMYYETGGEGEPLVLIHGGGSTIPSTFGKIMPLLAGHFHIIAVELQNHGRSGHRQVPETFEQDADDVTALLKQLGIKQAHIFGFSNGGHTALQMAMRHPGIADKMIVASSPVKRDGFVTGFFQFMDFASIDNMPAELKKAFLEVNPSQAELKDMFEKDKERMIRFRDFPVDSLKQITIPVLLLNGTADVITKEHAEEMHALLPKSKLVILPGGHGTAIGEISAPKAAGDSITALPVILDFLK